MLQLEQREQDLLKVLGVRLRAARKARGLTQTDFGRYLGITRQTYSKMEHGDPGIDVGYWIRASAMLDCLEQWANVITRETGPRQDIAC